MRHLTALCCLAIAFATGGALAQGEYSVTVPANVFISPAGQPFHGTSAGPYAVALWIAQADADKDGRITESEFDSDAQTFFASLDQNHDGFISSAENTRYENQVAPEIIHTDPRIDQPKDHYVTPDPDMDANPTGDKTRYIKQILGAAQYGLIDEPQPIRAADANFDFRISGPEWVDATAQRFAVLDRNGDGALTADELPRTPLQIALEAPKEDPKKSKKKGLFGW